MPLITAARAFLVDLEVESVRTDALPHWTRFAILPGLMRNGSYAAPQWLKRRE